MALGDGEVAGRRVLLVGIPRSGTTWIANALSKCDGVTLVHEPDNDRHHVPALVAKARLGRHPVLRPGDAAPAYARLFEAAFRRPRPDERGDRRRARALALAEGDAAAVDRVMAEPGRPWPWRLQAARLASVAPAVGDPDPQPRVVKTVHAALAAEWLVGAVRPDAAFVVVRHPANVIGSWRDLGWGLHAFPWRSAEMWQAYGPPEGDPGVGVPDDFTTRAAWHFALLANALVVAAERCDLPLVDHEDVLRAPASVLAELAGSLGLGWNEAAETWVGERDRPGAGYEIERVAADEIGRWRSRLSADELAVVAGVVDRFPRLRGRWELEPSTTVR